MLSVCHSIICEEDKVQKGETKYTASSPDELALVNFAKFCGYEFCGIDQQNCINIKVPNGQILRYELLHELEFNSTRKRMSVIVRDLQTNNIVLYTKGADSIIEKRMAPMDEKTKAMTWDALKFYAETGLRTLILAKKVLNPLVYIEWK